MFRTNFWKQSSQRVKNQKQLPEVFYEKRCSYKFHKIYSKTPVPEACTFIKKETLAQVLSCEFCEISKNTFFTEQLWWLLPTFHTLTTLFSEIGSIKKVEKDI